MHFLTSIEESGLAQWVREADSVFAFPGVLLIHTIGMGLVVGLNAIFDIRILGIAPALPLPSMKKFFPAMWIGFGMNAATGTILFLINSTRMSHNPDFYAKMVFIALAVINFKMLEKEAFVSPSSALSMKAKTLAATSLLFWLCAITAGRLLAYVGESVHTF